MQCHSHKLFQLFFLDPSSGRTWLALKMTSQFQLVPLQVDCDLFPRYRVLSFAHLLISIYGLKVTKHRRVKYISPRPNDKMPNFRLLCHCDVFNCDCSSQLFIQRISAFLAQTAYIFLVKTKTRFRSREHRGFRGVVLSMLSKFIGLREQRGLTVTRHKPHTRLVSR